MFRYIYKQTNVLSNKIFTFSKMGYAKTISNTVLA